ncbi:MAG TPA: hypothetical protein PLD84_00835 [Chitinophagales bacterium]|nr:hypothetical protein [Chitinophagales bacterium]
MMEEERNTEGLVQGAEFVIPPEGSLGLLALGAVAMKPWRQKRIETGYEAQLVERTKKQVEEGLRKKEERQKKLEEAKLKKEQEQNEQKNS